jgi:hypothetical protein
MPLRVAIDRWVRPQAGEEAHCVVMSTASGGSAERAHVGELSAGLRLLVCELPLQRLYSLRLNRRQRREAGCVG